MARVGVWTRPADQAVFSFRLFSRLVRTRVAFIPISQSERARQAAASASPWSSSPDRSCSKPLRTARSVIDWSHRRRIGFSQARCSTISRKISSPSRPASQAFTTSSMSLRFNSFLMVRMRSPWPFLGLRRNSEGMMGRASRVQRLYLSSISSGGSSSKRWPTANVTTWESLSK